MYNTMPKTKTCRKNESLCEKKTIAKRKKKPCKKQKKTLCKKKNLQQNFMKKS